MFPSWRCVKSVEFCWGGWPQRQKLGCGRIKLTEEAPSSSISSTTARKAITHTHTQTHTAGTHAAGTVHCAFLLLLSSWAFLSTIWWSRCCVSGGTADSMAAGIGFFPSCRMLTGHFGMSLISPPVKSLHRWKRSPAWYRTRLTTAQWRQVWPSVARWDGALVKNPHWRDWFWKNVNSKSIHWIPNAAFIDSLTLQHSPDSCVTDLHGLQVSRALQEKKTRGWCVTVQISWGVSGRAFLGLIAETNIHVCHFNDRAEYRGIRKHSAEPTFPSLSWSFFFLFFSFLFFSFYFSCPQHSEAAGTRRGCGRTWSTMPALLPASPCPTLPLSNRDSIWSPVVRANPFIRGLPFSRSCTARLFQSAVEAAAWQRLIKWRFTRGQSEEQSLTL